MRRAPVKRGWTTMRSPVERSSTTSFARRHAWSMVAPTTRAASCAALTSRRTSALETRTATMRAPATSRSRSRAMVSVSGSSGMSRFGEASELPPTDVGAVLFAVEFDARRVARAALLSIFERVAQAGDREYAPSAGRERAIRQALGPRVEDEYLVRRLGKSDAVAGPRPVGVAGAREDGRHGVLGSAYRSKVGNRFAAGDCEHEVE